MVVRANKMQEGIGGHISQPSLPLPRCMKLFQTISSAPDRQRTAMSFTFRGTPLPEFIPVPISKGVSSKEKLQTNFRRELKPGGGLSSYPHPYSCPEFWEFPTVSMGLGPIQAIYHARFIVNILENRGLCQSTGVLQALGVFLGDGEMDEPVSLSVQSMLASARAARQPDLRRELQPAAARRSCSAATERIIQELEAIFSRRQAGTSSNASKFDWD